MTRLYTYSIKGIDGAGVEWTVSGGVESRSITDAFNDAMMAATKALVTDDVVLPSGSCGCNGGPYVVLKLTLEKVEARDERN